MATIPYREAVRVHTSVLASLEKRCLIWMAGRMPGWPSIPTTSRRWPRWRCSGLASATGTVRPRRSLGAIALLAVNWFGDSLDGTLARVRHHERPRYGFYVDHVLDVVGILFIIGGLVARRPPEPADRRRLPDRLLPADDGDRARHARGRHVPHFVLALRPDRAAHPAGDRARCGCSSPTRSSSRAAAYLLFDIGCGVAIVGLLATFVASAVANTRTLLSAEPLPGRLRTRADAGGPRASTVGA